MGILYILQGFCYLYSLDYEKHFNILMGEGMRNENLEKENENVCNLMNYVEKFKNSAFVF